MRIIFLIFLCGLQTAHAQQWQDTVNQLQAVIAKYYEASGPGGQLSIARGGREIFAAAWGMADLERKVPMQAHAPTEAGSVSKQFTAAAVLLLEQQGKLSLEDDIRKYVPEMPDYGSVIHIRQLMDHSSGLRDWGSVASLTGWPRGSKAYRNEDALEIMARQQALNHVPGAEFIYSNSNYNLMAVIVQRVSGMSLAAFTKKHIFKPAGMTHTQWRDDPNRIVPDRAIAYSPGREGWQTDMPNEYVYGNGGLLTTAQDLHKWTQYWLDGKLGTPSLRPKQTQAFPFNNGVTNDYAAGLFLQPILGKPTINHSGATAGYRAYLVYFPGMDLTMSMLFNTSKNFNEASRAFFQVFANAPEPAAPAVVAADPDLFSNQQGWYRNQRDGNAMLLEFRDGKVLADLMNVQQVAPAAFIHQGGRYEMDAKLGLRRVFPGRDTMSFTKAHPPLTTLDLKAYIGNYHSLESASDVQLLEQDGKLLLQLKPGERYVLTPTYYDGFRVAMMGGHLYMQRNQRGDVTGFRISVSRVRNLSFVKQG